MLKLVSINIEMNKHYETVLAFLNKENPDVICAQEATEEFAQALQKLGYKTNFVPTYIQNLDNKLIQGGLLMASKFSFLARTVHYHKTIKEPVLYDGDDKANTRFYSYIIADITTPENTFTIITTHLPDTINGEDDEFQTQCANQLLSLLNTETPHLICGDFNMPRGYNSLYELITKQYKDNIPNTYKSSLDKNLHRRGNDPEINRPIFDIYMVDYIFTKPEYQVTDVRLEFGVSDHAAVVSQVSKNS